MISLEGIQVVTFLNYWFNPAGGAGLLVLLPMIFVRLSFPLKVFHSLPWERGSLSCKELCIFVVVHTKPCKYSCGVGISVFEALLWEEYLLSIYIYM